MCGKHNHKQRDCPQSQQGVAGKGIHVESHGQTPSSSSISSNPQAAPLNIPGASPTAWPVRLPPSSAPANITASNAAITDTKPVATQVSTQNDDAYLSIRLTREMIVSVDNAVTETVQHQVSQVGGPKMQRQFFTTFWCSFRHPRGNDRVVISAPVHPRVSWSCSRVEVIMRVWIRWRLSLTWRS